MMEATWEAYYEAHRVGVSERRYHIFSMSQSDLIRNTNNNHNATSATIIPTVSAISNNNNNNKDAHGCSTTSSTSTCLSTATTIKVSQVAENNMVPFWAARQEAKDIFIQRFGYDPEDVYRIKASITTTSNTASHSHTTMTMTMTNNTNIEPNVESLSHYHPYLLNRSNYRSQDELNTRQLQQNDDEYEPVTSTSTDTSTDISHNNNKNEKMKGKGKYKHYKTSSSSSSSPSSSTRSTTATTESATIIATASTPEVVMNPIHNTNNDNKGSNDVHNNNEGMLKATTRQNKGKYKQYNTKDSSNSNKNDIIITATIVPNTETSNNNNNNNNILTEPTSATSTTTSAFEPELKKYRYHQLCQPFYSPPLDITLSSRLARVQEELQRNVQIIQENKQYQHTNIFNNVTFNSSNLLYINMGGIMDDSDWININIAANAGDAFQVQSSIQVIRQMHLLIGFPNSTISALYASHILEHTTMGDHLLIDTLLEWRRVIRPGGLLFLSVPDLAIITKLYQLTDLTFNERLLLMRMMYGGQMDAYDYHHVGLDYHILYHILTCTGFCEIQRVGNFNVLNYSDTSSATFRHYKISLNLIARSCPDYVLLNNTEGYFEKHYIPDEHANYDGFRLSYPSTPYIPQEIP